MEVQKMLLMALLAICVTTGYSAKISRDEFNASLTSNGYPVPTNSLIYTYLADKLNGFCREEIAILLAQMIHESGGFQFVEETACTSGENNCAEKYKDDVGLPGKVYYGRGFIQMRYGRNYRSVSRVIGLRDTLLQKPELVANDPKIDVAASVAYWKVVVRPKIAGKEDQFGASTKALNPDDCPAGSTLPQAQNRYAKYLEVAKVLKINNLAKENGCYN